VRCGISMADLRKLLLLSWICRTLELLVPPYKINAAEAGESNQLR
jgi:hypothetical protein